MGDMTNRDHWNQDDYWKSLERSFNKTFIKSARAGDHPERLPLMDEEPDDPATPNGDH
jgi:hypothetical protein